MKNKPLIAAIVAAVMAEGITWAAFIMWGVNDLKGGLGGDNAITNFVEFWHALSFYCVSVVDLPFVDLPFGFAGVPIILGGVFQFFLLFWFAFRILARTTRKLANNGPNRTVAPRGRGSTSG